ncbi:O-antigen ligase family protein [Pacificimonas sp. WHA3]|uniref:O-antigen ligase family protein n=1 Tax=Pacificimonas pallii TaxID=2827236 RepID=A0ABS6SH17_9SPHN|nr:O-antigen ligase family protein [Pacificimonas pallii]MBV7257707.1 O-antigen ligase family protein [Pacificimonas pallii]
MTALSRASQTTAQSTPRATGLTLLGGTLAILPLVLAVMYRTYWYHIPNELVEATRQASLPFIIAEICVIAIAMRGGYSPVRLIQRLDPVRMIALLVFLATFWISSATTSEMRAHSVMWAAYWPIHLLFAGAAFHLCQGATKRQMHRLAYLTVLGLAAYVPILVMHLAYGGPETIWNSAMPGYLSVRHLGIFCAAVLAGLLGMLWLREDEKSAHAYVVVGILLSATLLMWSGTRSGIYAIVGASVITMIMLQRAPSWRRMVQTIALLLTALALSFVVWMPPSGSFGMIRVLDTGGGDAGFSTGRMDIWLRMMAAFIERPFLGHGEGASLWLMQPLDLMYIQPHNAPLQFLVSWGLIPTAAITVFALSTWWRAIRAVRRTSWLLPCILVINSLLIIALVDGVFFFPRFIVLAMAATACCLAVNARLSLEEQSRARRPIAVRRGR